MILKIVRNYPYNKYPTPEVVVECERYDTRAFDPQDNDTESAENMFCDKKGEVDPTHTLITFRKKKFASLFVLGNATVFVMNNEGKTIDIIYT